MKILITGVAGFIGSHLAEKILKTNYKRNVQVIGVDNLNDYYSPKRKEANVSILNRYSNFTFIKEDVVKSQVINEYKPDIVIHLASMAGVRYSLENPIYYAKNNILSQINLLEQCVQSNITNFIYASSSSVYGLNKKIPFTETDPIDKCNSPYATSKLAMENYAQLYHQLYGISTIGLRFFTVYGPRGRPDMAPYKFLKAIHNGEEITKFGDGTSMRDYTYIDDIVGGILGAIHKLIGDRLISENKTYNVMENPLCEVYNLGNNTPIQLNTFISICEDVVNKKAKIKLCSKQKGDVPVTYANIDKAKRDLNYNPSTSINEGLKKTYKWFKSFYSSFTMTQRTPFSEH